MNVTKSIRIDPKLWKKVKIYVAENDLEDISTFIEKALERELKGKKK